MYRIDRASNQITQLKKCSFSELGFRERAHLQEWIANQPRALGEDLLIIQKEFAGFSDTNERLDLLALDKQGSLVIIENKLDDTGRDVTWQALKYASYCASLSRDSIKRIFQQYLDTRRTGASADQALCDFFGVEDISEIQLNNGVTQRIMLIAANFRKEVTSTVLWLLNFKVRVQCFKATPYSMDQELLLNVEQIIPLRDTEEFMIGFADKAQDEVTLAETQKHRHVLRKQFWSQLFEGLSGRTTLYQNITPSTQSWTTASSGVRGLGFNFSATKDYCRGELYIDRGDGAENDIAFNYLAERRLQIEECFGAPLVWEPLEGRRACRIKFETDGNIFDQEMWPDMTDFLTDGMLRFEKAVRPHLDGLNAKLRM